jgi:predicted HTH transcriptional regulator
MAKDRQIAALQQVIGKLQAIHMRSLGKSTAAVIRAMDKAKRMTPDEVAKILSKDPSYIASRMKQLVGRGILRRCGWRDIPGARWPRPIYECVPANANGDGAT